MNARQALVVLVILSSFLTGSCRQSQQASLQSVMALVRAAVMEAPRMLTSLSDKEVIGLFGGKPKLVRHEGSASLWQYQSAACTLTLYLNQDLAGAAKVSYYDVWSRTPVVKTGGIVSVADEDERGCVKDVIENPLGQDDA